MPEMGHQPELQAQIDAANAYESVLVPALFQEWAPRIADAARIEPGQRVLDVACGTGVLARSVAGRTGPRGSVTGVDPNPGMLAVAERLAPVADWREGFAEALPFRDGSFDVVVSQFGLMFFTDRGRAVREMLRVLTPGGRLAVAVWNSLDSNPAYAAEVDLLEREAGPHAADALRAPFALGDPERLAALFAEAGAASIEVTAHRCRAGFSSVRTMVEVDLRGWLPVMGVILTEEEIGRILVEAESALRSHVTEEGRVSFDSSALVVTASKP